MIISSETDLDQLADRMGGDCDRDDARHMRAFLVAEFDGADTAAVPESRWFDLVILSRAKKDQQS